MSAGVTNETRATRDSATDDLARDATRGELGATRDEVRSPLGLRVLAGVRLLLVALWLGGAVFFSFVVAPTVFQVLPSRELAGAVVTRTIAVVNVGGFVAGLLLLASAFAGRGGAAGRRRRARAVEIASLAVLTVACGVGHWVVSVRMVALRAAMGRPIDRVPLDDPSRAAFDSLHKYSVALMCVAIIAGTVALFAVSRRRT